MKEAEREDVRSIFTTYSSQQLLKQVLQQLQQTGNNVQLEQVIRIFQEVKQEYSIPLSIFSNKLYPAEALCKHLRETEQLSFKDIALLLQRSEKSVWSTYQRASLKMKPRFTKRQENYSLPIAIFQNRSYSFLESVIFYMNRVHRLKTKNIAALLGKSPNSMAVLLKRAREKNGK